MSEKDYHSLMRELQNKLNDGEFGYVEVAGMFYARYGGPIQIALRNLETRRVGLVDLFPDGTVKQSA